MEAAEPIQFITTDVNFEEEKIDFIENILIKKENEEYKIKFGIIKSKKKLVIKVTQENYKDLFYYQKNYTILEFQNLSVIFSIYKTVEDIIKFLKDRQLKIELIKDLFIIKFNVYMPDGKSELIKLDCKKIRQDDNSIINYFLGQNKLIQNNISNIEENTEKEIAKIKDIYKKEVPNLKEIKDNNKKEISKLKEDKKKLEIIIFVLSFIFAVILYYIISKLNKISENIENIYKLNFNSKIIYKINSLEFIFDYIRENDKSLNFNNIKLLYRGSRDGDRTKTCHKLCDNKQNVLIIIQSDKGYTFGGYSKIGFKTTKKSEFKKDNNSFLFSIDLQKKYPVVENDTALYYDNDNLGLCFFVSLCFGDNFMNLDNNYIGGYKKEHFKGLKDKYEMNGGERYFKIKELEVFQLL